MGFYKHLGGKKVYVGVFFPTVISELSVEHPTKLLPNAVLSCFYIALHLHIRHGHHYTCSHLQHQARSIIFLENHYGCVFSWGRSKVGENRSSGIMLSSDLITSGAQPDSEKWFLVLSLSVCHIHYGRKMAVINSWHSKFLIFLSEYCQLRVAVISVSEHRTNSKCLGTYSTSHCAVCEEVIKCYLSSSSL